MNKKIVVILTLSIIILLILGATIYIKKNNQTTNNQTTTEEQEIAQNNNETNEVNEIFETHEENGLTITQVKPNIQYQTVLAGILKNDKPTEEDINNMQTKQLTKTGIWVSSQSREAFSNLLQANGINDYTINEEGYLQATNSNPTSDSQKINEAINSKMQYIIDCQGKTYTRDDLTGEITEYPFEQMDPYQTIDTYSNQTQPTSKILEITTNKLNKVTNEQILQDLLLNLQEEDNT